MSQLDLLDFHRAAAIDTLHAATAIYTAEPVVDDLLARLNWPAPGRRLLDPSCGDGAFVTRALCKLLATCTPSEEALLSMVEGWEIHPGACSQARQRVADILVAHGWSTAQAGSVATRMIHNRDFLTEGPESRDYDVISGNPPYLRMLKVPSCLREEYVIRVPRHAAGDLLHSFLDRCAKTLRPAGEIGFVTSDRWLISETAQALRHALGNHDLAIAHIERLDCSTAFYRPKLRRAGSLPRVHPVAVHLRHGRGNGVALTRAPIYPGVDASRYAGYPTLGELAEVRIAPWLGTKGVFVVDEAVMQRLIDDGAPVAAFIPAVDTDDVRDGVLGTPTRYAILTDPKEAPHPAILRHLVAMRGAMCERGKRGAVWTPPETFHRMDLRRPSLLVPRIAVGPKAVRVPKSVLPLNHNLSIVTAEPAELSRIEQALRAPLAQAWVEDHAPRLEDGYFSLTTRLLRTLPMDMGWRPDGVH